MQRVIIKLRLIAIFISSSLLVASCGSDKADKDSKASPSEIAGFSKELDQLDKATKEAIEEVDAKLKAQQDAINEMIKRAPKLPDGSPVFQEGVFIKLCQFFILPKRGLTNGQETIQLRRSA